MQSPTPLQPLRSNEAQPRNALSREWAVTRSRARNSCWVLSHSIDTGQLTLACLPLSWSSGTPLFHKYRKSKTGSGGSGWPLIEGIIKAEDRVFPKRPGTSYQRAVCSLVLLQPVAGGSWHRICTIMDALFKKMSKSLLAVPFICA